jgi:hypothetical protein
LARCHADLTGTGAGVARTVHSGWIGTLGHRRLDRHWHGRHTGDPGRDPVKHRDRTLAQALLTKENRRD